MTENTDEHDPRCVAIHEAAHAVLALLLGASVTHVSTRRDDEDGTAGRTSHRSRVSFGLSDAAKRSEMIYILGARVAEEIAGLAEDDESDDGDRQSAATLALSILGGGPDGVDAEPLFNLAREAGRALLRLHWETVLEVADEVEGGRELDGADLRWLVFREDT